MVKIRLFINESVRLLTARALLEFKKSKALQAFSLTWFNPETEFVQSTGQSKEHFSTNSVKKETAIFSVNTISNLC